MSNLFRPSPEELDSDRERRSLVQEAGTMFTGLACGIDEVDAIWQQYDSSPKTRDRLGEILGAIEPGSVDALALELTADQTAVFSVAHAELLRRYQQTLPAQPE